MGREILSSKSQKTNTQNIFPQIQLQEYNFRIIDTETGKDTCEAGIEIQLLLFLHDFELIGSIVLSQAKEIYTCTQGRYIEIRSLHEFLFDQFS